MNGIVLRTIENILVLGASSCLAVLALAGCGSDDKRAEDVHLDPSSTTASATSGGTSTSGAGTTATSATTSTSGGAGMTTTVGTTATSGTTGAQVTTGTTGPGATGSTGIGGVASVSSTTGSGTTGGTGMTGVTSSTTGGEDAVFCDPTLTGEEYYMRPQSCTRCHGEDALGTEDGPEARHPNSDYLRWLIREGRMDHPDYSEGMPAVPAECLTDAMIEEIITFLSSFPQPTTGQELYADYCANCHGEDAQGGVTGVSLNGELHENAEICPTGNDTMNYASRQTYMPGQGDKLTAAEIQLITDYLQNELGLRF